jgi:sugar phosphate isomerase/epimerase
MKKHTRRDFVRTFTGFAALAALPEMQFPTRPRDRLAVASYPFRTVIEGPHRGERDRNQPGIALKDFPALVVDRFGIHNIEPLGSHFPSTDPAYLHELRDAVDRAGSRIVNIPVGVGASLYDPDPAKREIAIRNSRKWVDVAAVLGSPGIRVGIQRAGNTPPDVDRASESLKSIAEHGAAKGVFTNLENDDLVSEDAFFLVKVIEKVNSPHLHALPDFCNSMLTGDEKFNYEAVAAMFRHAYNIAHVKDSEVDKGKVFRVDMGRTFAIAKASGYRGWFSMEWEGQAGPYEGTQHLIDESLKYL